MQVKQGSEGVVEQDHEPVQLSEIIATTEQVSPFAELSAGCGVLEPVYAIAHHKVRHFRLIRSPDFKPF